MKFPNPWVGKKLRGGVDLDGVVVNFNKGFIERVNRHNGTAWTEAHTTDYGYVALNLAPGERGRHFAAMLEEGDYAKLAPLPFYHLVNLLPGNVHLITSRPVSTAQQTLQWLESNEIFNFIDLNFATGPKSEYGHFDYFIEDHLDNVLDLAPVCEKIFLIDQPYNQCSELPANVERVKDWHQIINHFIFSRP